MAEKIRYEIIYRRTGDYADRRALHNTDIFAANIKYAVEVAENVISGMNPDNEFEIVSVTRAGLARE